MEIIKQIFDELGWIANALAIFTSVGGFLAWLIFKKAKPFIQNQNLQSLVSSDFIKSWSTEKSKKISTIAIADDRLQDFPTAELRQDGYNIQTFRTIKLSDIPELANYDIVFLDMKGIVKDDPEYGGLRLIGELRKSNLNQKICAVSGQTFDPTATTFFKQADDYKKKPLTAQECKSVIDQFLCDVFDIEKLLISSNDKLSKLPRPMKHEIIRAIRGYLTMHNNLGQLEKTFKQLGLSREQTYPLLTLSRVLSNGAN